MKTSIEKRMIFRRPMSATVSVFLLLATLGAVRADQERSEESVQAVPDRISVLVQELGADDFSRREKAQSQLRRLGLSAFDQLCDAQESDDIEIALRARYLLRSLAIRWADEDDPPQVKELLRGYDGKADDVRRNLMDQLAVLPAQQGITALCRLVRFEPSNVLSKHAALLIMQQECEDPKQRAEIATMIRDQVTLSRRPAADWLRVFLKTLESPEASLPEWGQIVENEQSVFQYTPEKSSIDTVRDLLRWYAGLLDRCGREEQALAAVQATINLLDGTRFQLLETVNWLIHRQVWDTVEEVASRFPERFEDSAELLYRLAESRLRNDREQLAQESAERALAMHPDSKQEHLLVAVSLQDRGLFAWAEQEYRFVLDSVAVGSEANVRGRFLLSEMLHDLERDQEAGDVLKDLGAALEKDDHAQIVAKSLGREIGGVRSRMYHFYAEHARRGKRLRKAKGTSDARNRERSHRRGRADRHVPAGRCRRSLAGEDAQGRCRGG